MKSGTKELVGAPIKRSIHLLANVCVNVHVLAFASWYWRLDADGPNARDQRDALNYLFLAFNTSTAFSPTDVLLLSRWAKLMMMVQALISLATVALLAARAVNIL